MTKQLKFVLVFIITSLLIVLHRPDMILNPQPFAEDAPVFLEQVRALGMKSIFVPYAGYYHLVPRVIFYLAYNVGLITGNGISIFPHLTNTAAIIISALSVLLILHPMFSWVAGLKWRIFLAFLIVTIPHSEEIFGMATNLQWWFGFSIFLVTWDMIVNNRFPTIAIAICMCLMSLSTPMGIFLCLGVGVVCARNIYKDKSMAIFKQHYAKILLLCIGFLAQLTLLINGRPTGQDPLPTNDIITYLINYMFGGIFARTVVPDFIKVVDVYKFSVFVLIGAIVATVIYTFNKNHKAAVFTAFGYLILLTALNLQANPIVIAFHKNPFVVAGGRYLFVSVAIVTTLLVFSVRNKRYSVITVLCALIVLTNIVGFKFFPFKDHQWRASTQNFDVNGAKTCEVPINPGWSYKYPCN